VVRGTIAGVIVLACIAVQDHHDESGEADVPPFEDIDIESVAAKEVG
jgi:hypothetical protein